MSDRASGLWSTWAFSSVDRLLLLLLRDGVVGMMLC
jgi:hypothetical protein